MHYIIRIRDVSGTRKFGKPIPFSMMSLANTQKATATGFLEQDASSICLLVRSLRCWFLACHNASFMIWISRVIILPDSSSLPESILTSWYTACQNVMHDNAFLITRLGVLILSRLSYRSLPFLFQVNIVLWLPGHDFSPPFSTPIDPKAMNLLDYDKIVQRRMDLSTIRTAIFGSWLLSTTFSFFLSN